MVTYRQITYRLPASREDDFAAWLAIRGSVGCSVDLDDLDGLDAPESSPEASSGLPTVRLTAYFEDGTARPPAEDLAGWQAVEESASRLDDADWLATYRAASVPFDVGASFRIDPGEPDEPDEPEDIAGDVAGGDRAGEHRTLLRIPARTAFGTGSHESTRLCILWLEELAQHEDFATWRILDVGTGSGILALCAEALGAPPVAGYDLDPASVIVARDNARRNGCRNGCRNGRRPRLWCGTLDSLSASLAQDARFHLALVNVLPERILADYPRLVARLRVGGRVVSSGNLVSRRGELLARFAELGLEPVGEKVDGEWISFLLRKLDRGSGGDVPPGRETTGLLDGAPSEGAPRQASL